MDYTQMFQYVESLRQRGIVPGLSAIGGLCARLGDPQDKLSYVHIAGTNGKGSVLAYISEALAAEGYKVGRYSSPAVSDYREIIQVNGRAISRKALCGCVEQVKEACEAMAAEGLAHPTLFEVETAAAFLFFAESGCDIAVVETGMGGREDATNLIRNVKAAVLTPIGMDHMRFLGETLAEIAAHKAGIIKPGCKVISAKQEPEAAAVIEKRASECGCELVVAEKTGRVLGGLEKQSFSYRTASGRRYEKLEISMAGRYQTDNAALAVEALEALGSCGYPVSEKALRKGLLRAGWPGRFQVLSRKPYFIADGAHNEPAAEKLADSLRFYFTNKRIVYIMGVLRDKEYEKVIERTYRLAAHIITVTPPENARALDAIELARTAAAYHSAVTAAGSIEEAVEMAYLLAGKDGVIVSFGSLSYLGRLAKVVEKRQKDSAGKKAARRVKR